MLNRFQPQYNSRKQLVPGESSSQYGKKISESVSSKSLKPFDTSNFHSSSFLNHSYQQPYKISMQNSQQQSQKNLQKGMKLSQQRSIFNNRQQKPSNLNLCVDQKQKVSQKENLYMAHNKHHNIYENSYKSTARKQDSVSENIQDTIDHDEVIEDKAIRVFDKNNLNQSNFQTENVEESLDSSEQLLKHDDDPMQRYLMQSRGSGSDNIDDILDLKISKKEESIEKNAVYEIEIEEEQPIFTFQATQNHLKTSSRKNKEKILSKPRPNSQQASKMLDDTFDQIPKPKPSHSRKCSNRKGSVTYMLRSVMSQYQIEQDKPVKKPSPQKKKHQPKLNPKKSMENGPKYIKKHNFVSKLETYSQPKRDHELKLNEKEEGRPSFGPAPQPEVLRNVPIQPNKEFHGSLTLLDKSIISQANHQIERTRSNSMFNLFSKDQIFLDVDFQETIHHHKKRFRRNSLPNFLNQQLQAKFKIEKILSRGINFMQNNNQNSIDSKKETSRFSKKTEHILHVPLKDPGIHFFKSILNSYKFEEDIEEQDKQFFQIGKCEVVLPKKQEVPKLQILKKHNFPNQQKRGSVRSVISERKQIKSERQSSRDKKTEDDEKEANKQLNQNKQAKEMQEFQNQMNDEIKSKSKALIQKKNRISQISKDITEIAYHTNSVKKQMSQISYKKAQNTQGDEKQTSKDKENQKISDATSEQVKVVKIAQKNISIRSEYLNIQSETNSMITHDKSFQNLGQALSIASFKELPVKKIKLKLKRSSSSLQASKKQVIPSSKVKIKDIEQACLSLNKQGEDKGISVQTSLPPSTRASKTHLRVKEVQEAREKRLEKLRQLSKKKL